MSTHTYIYIYLYISLYIYREREFSLAPGLVAEQKASRHSVRHSDAGEEQGGQDPALGRVLEQLRGRRVEAGCPGRPLPAERLGVHHLFAPCLSFPSQRCGWKPVSPAKRIPSRRGAGRVPGQGTAALRPGAVVAVPRGAALHHQQAQSPGE